LAHFDDLTECTYFGEELARVLRAVGWLTKDVAFPIGTMDAEAFDELKDLMNDPWQPMVCCGVHHCELCQFDPPCGQKILFVPNGSLIFVCPDLIVHYIAAHHYRPPDEFIKAVAVCPNTRTKKYKQMMLASGGRILVQ
jgi:hypothetical protein